MLNRYIKQLSTSLSPLGFGVMRLPQNADGSFPQAVHALISEAYLRGINYFDTAFPYLGGHSEGLIRDALVKQYPRNTFFIADKLPVWDCKNREDMERIFQTQLERLGSEYIDFYLLHGLYKQRWLDIYNVGVIDFLEEKRREGKIRKVGFSMHDIVEALKLIESKYDWDFTQLQINYYDWAVQHAKENYDYLTERNIPCMVMEPIGGGRLVNLPNSAIELLNKEHSNKSPANWALSFSASLPSVAVTLSGMSTIEQLDENIKVFDVIAPMSRRETDALNSVVQIIQSKNTIPCSSCRYCVDECPKNIDIPNIFQRYNDCKMFEHFDSFDVQYFTFIPDSRNASHCVSCGKCAAHCPQHIDIPRELKIIHNTAIALSIGVNPDKLRTVRNLTLFGAGADGLRTFAILNSLNIKVNYFCDNNPQFWGKIIEGIIVVSPQELEKLDTGVLIASSKYHDAIKTQLLGLGVNALNA